MSPTLLFTNKSVTNYAEISRFFFINGDEATSFDVDSYADADNKNDDGGVLFSPSDDEIGQNGKTGGDEDDHDPASVNFLDLALRKSYAGSEFPIQWGDTVEFVINLINQGNNNTKDILVTDYIPHGMTFLPVNEPEWKINSLGNPEFLYNDILKIDSSFDISLFLSVDSTTQLSNLINYAEISDFSDENGNKGPDIDSNPDNLDENDGDVDDDQIANENDDEDDHDIALVPIYDLALRKTIHSNQSEFYFGDIVTYKIEVINQGTMDATGVEVADKAQNGLEFLPDLNIDWKTKGDHFEYIPTIDVGRGETSDIFISFRIKNTASNNNILNQAEIILTRGLGGINLSDYDLDSQPDSDFGNDLGGVPGSNSDNQINDIGIADEDDADPTQLNLCGPLACKGSINVSLDNNCIFSLTPSILLIDTLPFSSNQFQIEYLDLFGNPITSVKVNEKIRVVTSVPSCPSSSCETEVLIEDKIGPNIICTPRDTVTCDNLNHLPTPQVNDLCNTNITIQLLRDEYEELCSNDSILAKITRTYRAVDNQGNTSDTCSSIIFVQSPDFNNTIFPSDSVISCDGLNSSVTYLKDAVFGVPMLNGFDLTMDTMPICNISAFHEDQVLVDTDCKKQIVRMWTITHWSCFSRDREIRSPQLITFVDTTAPIITLADTLIITNASNAECMATFELTGLTTDDVCDQEVDLQVYSDSLATNFVHSLMTLTMPVGTHKLFVQATDNCQNISRDSVIIIIEDNTPPLTLCLSNKVVNLSNGSAILDAMDFDLASIDGCSNVSMDVRRMSTTYIGSDLVFRDDVSFCCDDLNQDVMVALRVTDAAGNFSICMITVNVEDTSPNPGCNTNLGQLVTIEGEIFNKENEVIESTKVNLTNVNSLEEIAIRTGSNGDYHFIDMPTGGHYSLSPYKNDDWLNGVSTLDLILIQGHILGNNSIADPYNLIAADINNDGSISAIDIVQLRKLIIGISDEVQTNTSWRFIWDDQKLPNEFSLNEPLIEVYDIPTLNRDMEVNWKGIKIGDLSGNASSNALLTSESRTGVNETIEWDINQGKNQTILNFYTNNEIKLQGLQMEFSIPLGLYVNDLISGQLALTTQNLYLDNKSNAIALSLNNEFESSMDPELPLFSIILKGISSSEEDITINRRRLDPEIYSSGKAMTFALSKRKSEQTNSSLIQNEPNPWTEETKITFFSTDNHEIIFKIYDISGNVIYSKNYLPVMGPNILTIQKKDLLQEGVFLYEVSLGDKKYSHKMIHIK